jgi:hypothetical protein
MAYIIGYLTQGQEQELVSRGWAIEEAPGKLIPDSCDKEARKRYKMVWVDSDMLSIMSGPDWDKGPPKETERRIHRGT